MDRDTRNSRPVKSPSAPASADAKADARRVLVGRFGAAHGVKGEIRLQSFTENPKSIGKFKPLTDATGARQFVIESLRPARDNIFVARVPGVNDRNAAEALRNIELYFERARFPKPAKDEFYVADLVGMPATDPNGEHLGVIVNVANYGAGDILEISPPAGETLLIPFTLANVPEIDIGAGRVVVSPPVEVEAPPPKGEASEP